MGARTPRPGQAAESRGGQRAVVAQGRPGAGSEPSTPPAHGRDPPVVGQAAARRAPQVTKAAPTSVTSGRCRGVRAVHCGDGERVENARAPAWRPRPGKVRSPEAAGRTTRRVTVCGRPPSASRARVRPQTVRTGATTGRGPPRRRRRERARRGGGSGRAPNPMIGLTAAPAAADASPADQPGGQRHVDDFGSSGGGSAESVPATTEHPRRGPRVQHC